MRTPAIPGMRTYLYISYKCNCNCFFCASDKTNVVNFDNEVTLDDAKQFIINSPQKDVLIISGGEPTIHKDFLEIVRYGKKFFKQVSLMTNCLKFSDKDFLRETIDAGVDRISIPFYSSCESELNHMLGNANAYARFMLGLTNVNELLPIYNFDVRVKLLLAKFTYKTNPSSIDFIATMFPNIKKISLYGFHISSKALKHADECVVNYSDSIPFNDIVIQKLHKYGYDYQVCEIPLCAFSEEVRRHLIKSNRIAYPDEAYMKRPDWRAKIVSSRVIEPQECKICALYSLCPKVLAKNALAFNHGLSPIKSGEKN